MVHVHVPLRTAAAILLLLATGCAAPRAGDGRNRNLLTAAQIVATQAQNAYDAVQTLRPGWLSSRGPVSMTDPTPTGATVYMNGTRVGDLDYLRSVLIIDIVEIRYFPAGEAGARFGMGHPRGVIEVITGGR
jgi:hypothetical protein